MRVSVEGKKFSHLEDANFETITYSLTFDSDTCINVYVKLVEGFTENMTVYVDGYTVTPETLHDGRYRIRITGIHAQDLGKDHTVTVVAVGSTMSAKVSGLSYVYSLINNHQSKPISAMRTPRSIIAGKRHRISFPRTEKGDVSKCKDIFLPRWK